MPNTANHDIVERLERLEKNNRNLKFACLILLAAGSAVLFINGMLNKVPGANATADTGDVIEAKRFILVDSSGQKRGELSMSGVSPALVFYDADARKRLTTRLSPNGEPEILLSDKNGQQRLVLKVAEDNSGLYISDGNGNNRIKLITIGADSRANLTLQDSENNHRITLDSTDRDNNGGVLRIHNNGGGTAVLLMVDENKNGSVGVFNQKGMGRVLRP